MHKRLSMKNIQTFGQQNPFNRQRSLSSRAKKQSIQFPNQYNHQVEKNTKNMENQLYLVKNKDNNMINCHKIFKQRQKNVDHHRNPHNQYQNINNNNQLLAKEKHANSKAVYSSIQRQNKNQKVNNQKKQNISNCKENKQRNSSHSSASTPIFNSQVKRAIGCKGRLQYNSPLNYDKGSQPYNCNQIIYLLKHQNECIETVKQTVQNDKQKLTSHFNDFKQTINNIIDDLRLSICCHIDEQYQHFVAQFRTIKVQYNHYCNVKKQFWGVRQGEIQKVQSNPKYKYLENQSESYDPNTNTSIKVNSLAKYPGMVSTTKQQIDNQFLLKSIIQDLKDCKKHINYKQFSHIQERLLKPLLINANNMVRQLNIQTYYRPQIAHNTFKVLQDCFENDLHKLYQRMDLFITDHLRDRQQRDQLLKNYQERRQQDQRSKTKSKSKNKQKMIRFYEQNQRQQMHKNATQKYLNNQEISQQPENQQYYSQKQFERKSVLKLKRNMENQTISHGKQDKCHKIYEDRSENQANTRKQLNYIKIVDTKEDKYCSTAQSQNFRKISENPNKIQRNSSLGKLSQYGNSDKITFNGSKIKKNKFSHGRYSSDVPNSLNQNPYKNLMNANGPMMRLQQYKIISDKNYSQNSQTQSQTALCILYLQGQNKIAVGTKNGIIKIFCTITGTKLNELYGHKASICSLACIGDIERNSTERNMNKYIISGGDIGCCQVLLWDTASNSVYHNFNNHHKAAVTSIIDLQDNKHFMTGSFDCTMKIYNYIKKQLVKSIQTNQKITALVKLPQRRGSKQSKNIIISGNLNSQICVWQLCYNSFNSISGLQNVRSINLGTYPYCIIPLSSPTICDDNQEDRIMVAGKDSWLRVLNIASGHIQSAVEMGQCQELINMQCLDLHRLKMVLGCFKNGDISLISTDSNQIRQQEVGTSSSIIYSCGIAPKSAICIKKSKYEDAQSDQMAYLFLPNHSNGKQTQIRIWKIIGNNKNPNALQQVYSSGQKSKLKRNAANTY